MSRGNRVIAISVVTLVVVVVLVSMIVGAVREPITAEGLVFALGTLSLLATGSLLVLKVPENRLSWVLLFVALGDGLMNAADGSEMGSVIEIIGGIALFGLVLPGLGVFVPLWFPTGRPLSPRWRWVSWVGSLGVVGIVGGWAVLALEGHGSADVDACRSIGSCANIAGLILLLIAVVAAIVSLVIRWVRSKGVERLQMKWLVLAFAIFLIGVIAEFGGFQYSLVANVFLPAGFIMIPVAIGVAVTRYRLFEIDRILSRTVTYAIVIALLASVYFAGLAALTSLLSTDSPLAVAASTLAAAALFNPVRKRVQSWVDRHFNRSRYDAQRVVDTFSDSLRKDVDQDHLVRGWVGVVTETMHPAAAGVWIRQ
jgi:hypothetical protein